MSDWHSEWLPDWLTMATDWLIHWHTDCKQTDVLNEWFWWLIGWLTDGVVVGLAECLTDWLSHWLSDWPTYCTTDWLTAFGVWLTDWIPRCLILWMLFDWFNWTIFCIDEPSVVMHSKTSFVSLFIVTAFLRQMWYQLISWIHLEFSLTLSICRLW